MRDPLFYEAAEITVSHQQGSFSLIQRKLKIGFNRAAKILRELEEAGIVSKVAIDKPMDVMVHSLEELRILLFDSTKTWEEKK
jgi:S-DNA-T family DNA segregation ATPase FtsK/SpoIIIE